MFTYHIPAGIMILTPSLDLAVSSHLTLLSVLATHIMYLFYTYN